MGYYESAARRLDQTAFEQEAYEQSYEREQRVLTPLEGGHADERAREAVAPAVLVAVRMFSTLLLTLLLAGGLNVALSSGTVGILLANSQTSSAIKEMRAANDNLRNERSKLISADRIAYDATQKIGMVYANDAKTISID